jgi:aspartyl-tRNA(Asn)/glutamyl-tRNA(Gln) amidotransferase subunit A
MWSSAVLAGGGAWPGSSVASPIGPLPHADLAQMSAAGLAAAFKARTLSPVDTAQMLLARIEASQVSVNAFVHLDAQRTLAAAKASARRWDKGAPLGPLDGVPYTTKDADDLAVKGWPVTWPLRERSPMRRSSPD